MNLLIIAIFEFENLIEKSLKNILCFKWHTVFQNYNKYYYHIENAF
jgi:hypothetical protein